MPLRFTIRDLLWLTLVVALATGWWIDTRPKVYPPPVIISAPPAPEYDHPKVEKAVKGYLLDALRTDDLSAGLQDYLEKLADDGWVQTEIDAVRSRCEQAMRDIYNTPIDISLP